MIKAILALDASCLIYSIIFTIVFFSKKRIKSYETDVFAFAIITTIVGILIEGSMLLFAFIDYNKYEKLFFNLSLLYVIHYYVMYLYLTIYVFLKSYAKRHSDPKLISKMFKKLIIIFSIILLISISITLIFRGKVIYDGDSVYGTGISIVFIVLTAVLYGVSCFISLIRNRKVFTLKEKTFYYVSIVLLIISATTRFFAPSLMINNIINSIIIATMFFAIENPDIVLITELKKANEAKDKFLSSMSHEMKTPLNAILGLSSLEEYNMEYAKDINKEANVLLDIVNNVIDTNSFNADSIKSFKNEFNLTDSLSRVIDETKAAIEGKDIDFKYTIPNVTITANSNAIIGIVDRILSNSAKYTNTGYISLIISISDHILNINLKDSGIGMNEDALKNIYNRFERDKKNVDGTIPGLGLGLSLVKDTVDALGGTILITSKENDGTTVDINIKLD